MPDCLDCFPRQTCKRPSYVSQCVLSAMVAACCGTSAWPQDGAVSPGAPAPIPSPREEEKPSATGGNLAPTPGGPAKTTAARPAYLVGFQSTVVGQHLFRFRSPYQGPNSLRARNELRESETYTLILGVRPFRHLEFYLNPEFARGRGIGDAVGLGGYTNGDFITTPSGAATPYLARYYARFTVPLARETEAVAAAENQLPDHVPVRRIELRAGGLPPNDLFDVNSYATNPRTQFLNLAVVNSAAYDYAQDSRGYTEGVTVSWIHPTWSLRAGSFRMPRVAGGLNLADDVLRNRSDQVELQFHPRLLPGTHDRAVFRLMGFHNTARMGRFRDALRRARGTGNPPDVTAVRRPNAGKAGITSSLEQGLADQGRTAVFARFGWNDGATESFAYTEADRSFCVGGQLSGVRWGRPHDHVGLAFAQNGLSSVHRDYLKAGGIGFSVGDGRLSYGPERIIELYYIYQVTRAFSLTLDYQWISHLGYNRDRGPASALGLRLHLQY